MQCIEGMCDVVEDSAAQCSVEKSSVEGMLMEKDAKKKVKAVATWSSRGLKLTVQLPLPQAALSLDNLLHFYLSLP